MNGAILQRCIENYRDYDTKELLTILKDNDKSKYSEEILEAVRQILANRGPEIPSQIEVSSDASCLQKLHKCYGGGILHKEIAIIVLLLVALTLGFFAYKTATKEIGWQGIGYRTQYITPFNYERNNFIDGLFGNSTQNRLDGLAHTYRMLTYLLSLCATGCLIWAGYYYYLIKHGGDSSVDE